MSFSDTTAYSEAYSRVTPWVNGAPPQTIRYHLQQAGIEFLTRTLAWQIELPPVLTVLNQRSYTLPLPDDSQMVKLLGYSLGLRGDLAILDATQARRYIDHNAHVDGVWTEDRRTFNVNPLPRAADEPMVIRVALRPAEEATEIPAELFADYIADIADGAIGRICAMPRQTFSDMQQAELHLGKFERAINRVVRQVSKSFGRSRQRSRGFFY